jgi:hypothetical protein
MMSPVMPKIGRDAMPRIFSFAVVILALGSAARARVDPPPALAAEQSETQPFTVRAQLVDTQGKPLAGETVYCFIFKSGVAYSQLGMLNDRIVPASPKGTSDATGRFEIRVDREFIRKHLSFTHEFTVGVHPKSAPIPMTVNGVPVAFDLDLVRKAKNVVDLGRVTLDRPK